MTLKICVAQLDFVVGDLAGNAQRIIDAAQAAYRDGARLLLTPELSICGYAAEDLFLRPVFIHACDDAVKTVTRALAGLKGMTVVVGHPVGGGTRTRSVSMQMRYNNGQEQRSQNSDGPRRSLEGSASKDRGCLSHRSPKADRCKSTHSGVGT